jgi:hypothetical protein
MHVRVVLQQQAQTATQANPRTTERPERPERPEQPERPEAQQQSGPPPAEQLRAEIRNAIEAARQAEADAGQQRAANQVRIQNGFPVIAGGAQTHAGVPPDVQNMIPPQAVDIAIGFFVMCAVMVVGWPLARAFGRRLERGGSNVAVPAGMQEQLQRIEQAVDAMSIEIERISESQRFLAKLQAGAAEPAALQGERR